MKLVIIFTVICCCMFNVICNHQDDPNSPFWATRGRRSGRVLLKGDDFTPEKWSEDEASPVVEPVVDRDTILRKREQARALLQSLLNALSTRDNEIIKKRGDSKTSDPNNPFWAARG